MFHCKIDGTSYWILFFRSYSDESSEDSDGSAELLEKPTEVAGDKKDD